MTAEQRLATYGSLAPGRPNHHQLAGLTGTWTHGQVCGRLLGAGWGAALGFPGIVLDPDGDPVDVHIFESAELPTRWVQLDAFEGGGYRRVITEADTPEGRVKVSIYEVITTGVDDRRADAGGE